MYFMYMYMVWCRGVVLPNILYNIYVLYMEIYLYCTEHPFSLLYPIYTT